MLFNIITLSIFSVSFIYFFYKGVDINLLFIPFISIITYLLIIKDPKNQEKYHYADWTLTMPLMLYALLSANKIPLTKSLQLILLGQLMIFTTIIGNQANINFWFVTESFFFLPILYTVFYLKSNKPAVYLTLLLWSFYPIVRILQKDNIITPDQSSTTFSIMDSIGKIGLVDLLL